VGAFGLIRKEALMPTRQHLALRLRYLKHRLTLSLVLPQVLEKILTLRLVFANPLQAPFDEPLGVRRVEGQTELDYLHIVAAVIAYGGPALEHQQPNS
jgi:hypothetical protein